VKVFLSYAQSDAGSARSLAERLSRAGFEVWDPSRELVPGENWASKVGEALDDSDAMVVLLSPDSVDSQQVRREIEYALGSPRYEARLIPVVVRPTDKVPWILQRLTLVPFHGDPASQGEQVVRALKKAGEAAPPEARATH
jgi:hypothetical protein